MSGMINDGQKSGDWADKDISNTLSHTDRVAAADPRYVQYPAGQWDVATPHPGFGVDPNIKNELGHTEYPKMIYPEGRDGKGIVVSSAAEEANLMPKPEVELRQDGPTIQQYVEAGYPASHYPPKGYASKSTPEEIKEYTDKETNPWG